MGQSFAATVGAWTERVDGAVEAIFKESAQRLVEEMDGLLVRMVYDGPPSPNYKRTGFLRASLVASRSAMPGLVRENPGRAVPADLGDVMLVIAGAEIGETIYLGVTALYGAHVHYGANGRPPRPWVTMAAQRWPEIVATVAAEVKSRLGL